MKPYYNNNNSSNGEKAAAAARQSTAMTHMVQMTSHLHRGATHDRARQHNGNLKAFPKRSTPLQKLLGRVHFRLQEPKLQQTNERRNTLNGRKRT